MKKEKKKPVGRPKKHDIPFDKVEQLASFGCTNIEIASYFGCDESLLRKNYSEYLAKGRDKGKIRLRQLQWQAAEKGSHTMLIWLGKQILGQTDKSEVELVKPIDEIEFNGL
tara:strand:+ start:906 stop:1241 length:336 start_codon:yes stop_codon:yes gene_type:complete